MATLHASTNPNSSANVFASAGSGKTWLLITRICRLLLAGAAPQHILAITFTRKSAADMRMRLHERLSQWAVMPEQELRAELSEIGEIPSAQTIAHARNLFEQLLFSEANIRISTFHAFCEEVVRAFPLESELPAMFEITEHTHIYTDQAFQRLLQQSEQANETELREALQTLYEFCFGFNNTKRALQSFLAARNEWCMYTKDTPLPHVHAMENLETALNHDDEVKLSKSLEKAEFFECLQRYHAALVLSGTKSRLDAATDIETFIHSCKSNHLLPIDLIKNVFLTSKLEVRKLKLGKKWRDELGKENYEQLIADHQKISKVIINYLDQLTHEKFLKANQAWFFAGERLLQHYQKVKFQQGVVDFNDLEWETHRLLQQQEHALWVQYKLGESIHHFLVDEFQDTNPIQWHLLQPLIESSHEQHQTDFNSLFLVGDIKQSIYRFRGANPEIQRLAADWSTKSLASREYANNMSWRSSPTIIDCVNQVFSHPLIQNKFATFTAHDCRHKDRWGCVEIYPLIEVTKQEEINEFRNPLRKSRIDDETTAHFHEGVLIAKRIQSLIDSQTPIYVHNSVRPARFSDILILTRTRSHIEDIKAGLRSNAIPICINDSDHLLAYLEIKDMLALLRCLIDPYDDISLVHVLRSPIFSISNEHLLEMRQLDIVSWQQKLDAIVNQVANHHPLQVAQQKLQTWRKLVDRIPVHDLLSNIYASWNILDRYYQSTSSSDAVQITARLTQFLYLSLEIDSGRYSSISRFLRKIQEMNPEVIVGNDTNTIDAVQLMTVHGAKGLEAPIVFIADTGPLKPPPEQFKACIHWPASSNAPTNFMLSCKNSAMSKDALEIKRRSDQSEIESLNLLYVALTRAKQILMISGVQSKQGTQECWHQLLSTTLGRESGKTKLIETGTKPKLSKIVSTTPIRKTHNYDAKIFQPITPRITTQPNSSKETSNAANQGTLIHKCLEILSVKPNLNEQQLSNRIFHETKIEISPEELEPLKSEALACIYNANTRILFELAPHQRALNEVAIAHRSGKELMISVIDRLILSDELAWIIDYKTDRNISISTATKHLTNYLPQLKRYTDAVKLLHPHLAVRTSILFTKFPLLIDVDDNQLIDKTIAAPPH